MQTVARVYVRAVRARAPHTRLTGALVHVAAARDAREPGDARASIPAGISDTCAAVHTRRAVAGCQGHLDKGV